MKKSFALALALVAALAFNACNTTGNQPQTAVLNDGSYTAAADGHNGPLALSMTVKNGKIAALAVTRHAETAGLSDPAIARLPEAIVKAQSLAVDTVSGATYTSKAILDAAADCIRQAGGNPADFRVRGRKAQAKPAAKSLETEILVVGGGGSGLSAAVKAAEAGKKVLLIEKMPALGGDTILNAGTLIATGSRFQREVLKETGDSPELAYKDIMRIGGNVNDPVLVKMVTEKAGGVVDWLVDDLKIRYDVAATQYPDHSARRQIGVVGRSVAFIKQMSEKLSAMGGTILLETRATDLIVKNGRVVGVKATNAQGEKLTITAKSVVLATGGFGANTPMLPASLKGYLFYGIDSETGDGFKMATAIGANTINLDCVKVYPQGIELVPTRGLAATASSTAATMGHGAIYVNAKGQRVANEVASLGELTQVTIAQEGKIMYLVMDAEAWKTYVAKSIEDKLIAKDTDIEAWFKVSNAGKPIVVRNDDVAAAATAMGIDAKGLASTIEGYNAMCATGKDSAFGKPNPVALGAGPYYIVEQKPRFQTTLGGLKADSSLAILDKAGKRIPNLFGAGCVVGGANGKDSMTAMMNSWALVSGAVAGESAVANLKK